MTKSIAAAANPDALAAVKYAAARWKKNNN